MTNPEGHQPNLPEISGDRQTSESSIIHDFIEAAKYEVVPTPSEWELLQQPLLGRDGLGSKLFEMFREEAQSYGRGYLSLTVKVFPNPGLRKQDSLRAHEGNALIFSDELSGLDIDILYHEAAGVVTFNLIDSNEKASAGLSFAQGKRRLIKGLVTTKTNGEQETVEFVPTTAAQLVLLNIVDSLIKSAEASEDAGAAED